MKNLPIFLATVFLFGIFSLLTAIVGYWKFYPPNPADFDEKNIIITTPQVRAGGEFNYAIPIKKYDIYPAEISSTLISKDRTRTYALAAATGALPPGEYEMNIEVDIPRRVNPGIYQLCRIYAYTVNPNTIIMKSYITPEFEVLAPGGE